jgi:hypothetical protein
MQRTARRMHLPAFGLEQLDCNEPHRDTAQQQRKRWWATPVRGWQRLERCLIRRTIAPHLERGRRAKWCRRLRLQIAEERGREASAHARRMLRKRCCKAASAGTQGVMRARRGCTRRWPRKDDGAEAVLESEERSCIMESLGAGQTEGRWGVAWRRKDLI